MEAVPRALGMKTIWLGVTSILVVAAIVAGRFSAPLPSRTDLQERMGEVGDWQALPTEDVALELSYAVRAIHSKYGRPDDYADAIQGFMILGSRTRAQDVYSLARAKHMLTRDVISTADAWNLGFKEPHGGPPKARQRAIPPVTSLSKVTVLSASKSRR